MKKKELFLCLHPECELAEKYFEKLETISLRVVASERNQSANPAVGHL